LIQRLYGTAIMSDQYLAYYATAQPILERVGAQEITRSRQAVYMPLWIVAFCYQAMALGMVILRRKTDAIRKRGLYTMLLTGLCDFLVIQGGLAQFAIKVVDCRAIPWIHNIGFTTLVIASTARSLRLMSLNSLQVRINGKSSRDVALRLRFRRFGYISDLRMTMIVMLISLPITIAYSIGVNILWFARSIPEFGFCDNPAYTLMPTIICSMLYLWVVVPFVFYYTKSSVDEYAIFKIETFVRGWLAVMMVGNIIYANLNIINSDIKYFRSWTNVHFIMLAALVDQIGIWVVPVLQSYGYSATYLKRRLPTWLGGHQLGSAMLKPTRVDFKKALIDEESFGQMSAFAARDWASESIEYLERIMRILSDEGMLSRVSQVEYLLATPDVIGTEDMKVPISTLEDIYKDFVDINGVSHLNLSDKVVKEFVSELRESQTRGDLKVRVQILERLSWETTDLVYLNIYRRWLKALNNSQGSSDSLSVLSPAETHKSKVSIHAPALIMETSSAPPYTDNTVRSTSSDVRGRATSNAIPDFLQNTPVKERATLPK